VRGDSDWEGVGAGREAMRLCVCVPPAGRLNALFASPCTRASSSRTALPLDASECERSREGHENERESAARREGRGVRPWALGADTFLNKPVASMGQRKANAPGGKNPEGRECLNRADFGAEGGGRKSGDTSVP
jgi:hypothetical protein